ncbi:MAG: SDR family NAD(P)-dependent oxidoreductase [Anaerolineae bacterium]|jgi:gluconate 5-dehydrogenase
MISLDSYRNLYKLDGKVALVAGGAGGIGSAISEGLVAHGAMVVICGRSGAKAEAQASQIEAAGGRAWGAALDILNVASVGSFVDEVVRRFGSLDVLVNSAGTHVDRPAEDYTEEDWDRVLDLNLKAAFFLSQAVARAQIRQGSGKQIHISSVRSLLGIQRGYIAYCSSRGGMNMMIKQLATEWAKYRINVNGIAPTFTRTPLVKDYLEDPDFYNPLVARIPLGRICEPKDLAAMAVYLAAPASDFITGQIIFADGGLTATQ